MSHNAQRINDKEPNAAGNITLALGDLNDVTLGTLTNGHILKYNGAEWTTQAQSGSVAAEFIFTGNGSSAAYPQSTFTAGDFIYFHSGGLINNIAGSSITYKTGAPEWIESITLPQGRYTVIAQIAFEFSSTGYLAHFLTLDDTYISNLANIGSSITVYGNSPPQMQAILDITAGSGVLACKIHEPLNVSTTQPSFFPSKCNTYLIRRVE